MFISAPLQPFGSSSSTSTSQTVNGNVAPSAGGDKYSNLSDLFSSATTTDTETSVGAGMIFLIFNQCFLTIFYYTPAKHRQHFKVHLK